MRWIKYKEHLICSAHAGHWVYPGTGYVSEKFKIQFVDEDKERLDGASVEGLCKCARASCDHSIPPLTA